MPGETYYCEKCGKTMSADQFYSSNNLIKYPNDGKLTQCKKCLTMHVDNWNPDTYLWILQEVDVPYIPEEWNKLMASYAKDPAKVTGVTILGRYLSKMKLKQYKEYRWKDNEFIQQMKNHELEQAMKKQGYERAEIDLALQKDPYADLVPPPPPQQVAAGGDYFDQLNGFAEDDFKVDLTEEDKIYLRLKWGKSYKPEEWVSLEKLYNEMMESYEIQTAGHIDTLKLICKTSLKANQLIDIGDIDGYQKMSKVYDQLMKSGKFTAAQNKGENGEYVDSISELIMMCEKDGFIPRYYVDTPQDKVDYVIQDMQDYTHSLITEEMHLGTLIEKAVKQIEMDRLKELENELDDETEEEAFERELFSNTNDIITDTDFSDFKLFEEEEQEANNFLFDSWEEN